ncbi:MAG: gluconokinase [Akkermansiaceae bacterium]|nr:gluconokinase [Akkermansiaceae bacterium]
MESTNRVFVVMGVSGSGKSVVASEVARKVGGAMLDGDFLHPRANILKMSSGQSLNDDDRAPWLTALNDAAFAMKRTNAYSFIVCSALKARYRDRLREGNPDLTFIYLKGSYDLILGRMQARPGHFFKPQMLVTQFEALEEPVEDEADVIVIPIDQTLPEVVDAVIARITAGS